MPRPEPGKGREGLVDATVFTGTCVGHEHVVGRPDRRPAEALGDGCGGLEPFGRRSCREVWKADAEVHRPDGSGRTVPAPKGQRARAGATGGADGAGRRATWIVPAEGPTRAGRLGRSVGQALAVAVESRSSSAARSFMS